MSDKLRMILLCREMNWTFFDYLRQPEWFIEGLHVVQNVEGEHRRKKQRKRKQKQRSQKRRR